MLTTVRPAMVPLLMVLVLLGLLPWGLQEINRSADREAGRSAGSLSLSLLQGNIPQDEKFQPGTGVPIALLHGNRDFLLGAEFEREAGVQLAASLADMILLRKAVLRTRDAPPMAKGS